MDELPKTSSKAYRICAGFTLLSALVSAGFSLQALRRSKDVENALYATSRSVALPLAVVGATLSRSRAGLTTLAMLMSVIQLFDGIIGFRLRTPAKAYGPITFAAINAALLLWLRSTAPQSNKFGQDAANKA